VIVAGGAVNSPQLLLLSGIGPSAHLQKHGISTAHELPGVGENLQDPFCVMIKQEMSRPYSRSATHSHCGRPSNLAQ